MGRKTIDYFCSGALSSPDPCAKPAERVRAAWPDQSDGRLAYLCRAHQAQARQAGWVITPEPRDQTPSPEF